MAEQEASGTASAYTSQRAAEKYKIQLYFSGKSLADLEELKEITGAPSRAEVIRTPSAG